jgi:demethylmenaquinone methyltransferase / 2-methoxy-6-polyprenyl-1,4-benzoquinol methylase
MRREECNPHYSTPFQSRLLMGATIIPEAPATRSEQQSGGADDYADNSSQASFESNPDATLQGDQKARYVSGMFARIAGRYDLMNAIMSFGRDAAWRRYTVRKARPQPGHLALDVATGTGRIAQEIARHGAWAVGIDFCLPMMIQGRIKGCVATQWQDCMMIQSSVTTQWPQHVSENSGEQVYFAGADALQLPFADNTFDCVTSGFAMRNVTDIAGAFGEMRRVVKPGGRVVCLEVGRPRWIIARLFHALYTRKIVPLMGKLIGGDSDAYTYLPSSMGKFPPPDELARIMRGAGLRDILWKQLTFGAVAVHWGVK